VEPGDINGSISSPWNSPGGGQGVTSDIGKESVYISGKDASKRRAFDYPMRPGRIWFRWLADGEKELPGWRSARSACTCNPCSAETTAVDGTGTGTGFPPGRDRPSRTAVKPESSPRWK